MFIKELNIWGIKGLLNRRIQVEPASIPGSPALFNFADYQPTDKVEKNYQLPDRSLTYPVEDVDFTYTGRLRALQLGAVLPRAVLHRQQAER